jgi:hypothetical protein
VIVTGSDEECLEQPSPEQSRTIVNRPGIVEIKRAENRLRLVSAPVNDARESNRFACRQERITCQHHHFQKRKFPDFNKPCPEGQHLVSFPSLITEKPD